MVEYVPILPSNIDIVKRLHSLCPKETKECLELLKEEDRLVGNYSQGEIHKWELAMVDLAEEFLWIEKEKGYNNRIILIDVEETRESLNTLIRKHQEELKKLNKESKKTIEDILGHKI